jgi:GSH-dependent disulfide-bond oxidoreductase
MIEVFSTPTANGQKIHIMLEETGLAYRVRNVDLAGGEHKSAQMLAHNPLGKIPAINDPHGPDGLPISLGETAAIALYLARKAKKFGPETAREQAEFDYWSHAVSAGLAPPFAMQFYFTKLAPERVDWAVTTFERAARSMLGVFDDRMATRHFMIGERFTAIDALVYPHLATSALRLDGGLSGFGNLQRYAERLSKRDGVKRGMAVLQS